MFSGPGFNKPTHGYGEAFEEPDAAPVPDELDELEHVQAPYVPLNGKFCRCGRTWPCPEANPADGG